MDWSTLGYILLACLSIVFILCSCMGRRERGAIISPPITTVVVPATGSVPYPTQQTSYAMPTPGYPYPNTQTHYGPPPPGLNVHGGMSYPMPTPMYPNTSAPYPTHDTPYPPAQNPPYPHNATQDTNPPSYNEAVGQEAYLKQSPYNPAYPHS